MSYISCIIQILEIPKIQLYDNNIPMITFRTKLPYLRNKVDSVIIVNSVIWGNLAHDLVDYYRVNDYILIEGYTSIALDDVFNQVRIKLNIIKLYPFSLTIEKADQN